MADIDGIVINGHSKRKTAPPGRAKSRARGASLRDQFAMAALQGLLASDSTYDNAVEQAWKIADAMMEARRG